ncbi:MAG TPA: Ni/Fe hydrogenase subunit alpha [Candidatus Cloacimonetes bacterium]|nr:Ni/Fe hydrogenase subunit alpha [Candidatus Cloacimonadota bacterium]
MKKVIVDHLARVEGDGGIYVELDGEELKKVEVKIFEGPRLIEALAIGKLPEEVVSFTPRICAICTVSHKNASIRAIEKALNFQEQEKTHYLRELMHLGEIIESHSLHIFALALPDYFGYPNVIAMADKHKDIVIKALTLKKFGNKIMQVINGKFIHGENATIGGFGKFPSNDDLLEIKKEAKESILFMSVAMDIIGELELPDHLEEETIFACCNPENNKFGFWGDEIIFSNGTTISCRKYKENLVERVVPHSFAKRSLYKDKPFTVGALARLNCIGDRLKGKAAEYFNKYKNERWLKNPLYNNLAQAIEIIYCLEQILKLVDILLKLPNPEFEKPKKTKGRGVGTVEAPRGLLVHDYSFNKGYVTEANIITPTAYNLDDIEKYIGNSALNLNKQGYSEDKIAFELEKIVRAYDPCISCATHLVNVVKR